MKILTDNDTFTTKLEEITIEIFPEGVRVKSTKNVDETIIFHACLITTLATLSTFDKQTQMRIFEDLKKPIEEYKQGLQILKDQEQQEHGTNLKLECPKCNGCQEHGCKFCCGCASPLPR